MNRDTDIRPRRAFRVGFVGHRDLGLDSSDMHDRQRQAAIERQIRQVLSAVTEAMANGAEDWGYNDDPPEFFMLNSLAEGSDQIAASIAIEPSFGFKLRVPIPCAIEPYLAEFSIDAVSARSKFRSLIGGADSEHCVITLDNPFRTQQQQAQGYRAAARVLLDNSDLLIAVLRPDAPIKRGGTAETVAVAEKSAIPIVTINPDAPEESSLTTGDRERITQQLLVRDLRAHVRRIVAPFRGEWSRKVGTRQMADWREYCRDVQKMSRYVSRPARTWRWIYAFWWKLVEQIGRTATAPEPPPTEGTIRCDRVSRQMMRLSGPYRRQHAIADALSDHFMLFYRGSYVQNFLLGGFAVLFALLTYFHERFQSIWLGFELVVLFLIGFNYIANRRWRWNDKAIDYRNLAEYFRHMTSLATLCRVAPYSRLPVHARAGDPEPTWMNWYFRAVVRQNGVANSMSANESRARQDINLDRLYMHRLCPLLKRHWLADQKYFHLKTAAQYERVHRTIAVAAAALFLVVFGTVAIHGVEIAGFHPAFLTSIEHALEIYFEPDHWRAGALTTLILAALPVFLAALHGISTQAEFERFQDRYTAMAEQLEAFEKSYACETFDSAGFGTYGPLAERSVGIAKIMLEETLDWRVIHSVHSTELT